MKDQGIEVVTRVRKGMLEVMYSDFDRALLCKRSLVETVFDELKNLCQIRAHPASFAEELYRQPHGGHRGLLPATRQTSY